MRVFSIGIVAVPLLFVGAHRANAGLLGTNLSVEVLFQSTQGSAVSTIGFETTATVVEPGVEFPDLSTTQQANAGNLAVVPVAVDAGDDYIEISVVRSSGGFSAGFFNGYKFTFESDALLEIIGAEIDLGITTLAITAQNITFEDNFLFVNVAGRSFNANSIIRLNLTTIPEPATAALFATGLLALGRPRRSM